MLYIYNVLIIIMVNFHVPFIIIWFQQPTYYWVFNFYLLVNTFLHHRHHHQWTSTNRASSWKRCWSTWKDWTCDADMQPCWIAWRGSTKNIATGGWRSTKTAKVRMARYKLHNHNSYLFWNLKKNYWTFTMDANQDCWQKSTGRTWNDWTRKCLRGSPSDKKSSRRFTDKKWTFTGLLEASLTVSWW